jgi:hypothetical protein
LLLGTLYLYPHQKGLKTKRDTPRKVYVQHIRYVIIRRIGGRLSNITYNITEARVGNLKAWVYQQDLETMRDTPRKVYDPYLPK